MEIEELFAGTTGAEHLVEKLKSAGLDTVESLQACLDTGTNQNTKPSNISTREMQMIRVQLGNFRRTHSTGNSAATSASVADSEEGGLDAYLSASALEESSQPRMESFLSARQSIDESFTEDGVLPTGGSGSPASAAASFATATTFAQCDCNHASVTLHSCAYILMHDLLLMF
eukprot:SAG31_NODE_3379_length_4344_cov_1.425442_2_plen_173_part_00